MAILNRAVAYFTNRTAANAGFWAGMGMMMAGASIADRMSVGAGYALLALGAAFCIATAMPRYVERVRNGRV